ncbi:hypothetical protein BHM03_00011854 [Ensete ventricosum]|nr:hypothetical protein BHM03_00011854 [Ensete ventricosum]
MTSHFHHISRSSSTTACSPQPLSLLPTSGAKRNMSPASPRQRHRSAAAAQLSRSTSLEPAAFITGRAHRWTHQLPSILRCSAATAVATTSLLCCYPTEVSFGFDNLSDSLTVDFFTDVAATAASSIAASLPSKQRNRCSISLVVKTTKSVVASPVGFLRHPPLPQSCR